jgi:membrane associated rhomboid family serine protease
LNELMNQLQYLFAMLQANLTMSLMILGIFWLVHLVNVAVGYRLNYLGIYPRHLMGVFGIVCSPFLHANFNHLFFNSIPLFVLLNFILLQGLPKLLVVSLIIIVLSGSATWLVGRKAIHIGASSLVMGYWSYLIVTAIQHPNVLTVVLGILCLYYFGGLVMNLLPQGARDSWEGHLFGFLAGLAAYYLVG